MYIILILLKVCTQLKIVKAYIGTVKNKHGESYENYRFKYSLYFPFMVASTFHSINNNLTEYITCFRVSKLHKPYKHFPPPWNRYQLL